MASLTDWQDLVRSVKPTAKPVSGPGYSVSWSNGAIPPPASKPPMTTPPVATPAAAPTSGPSMRSWDGVSGQETGFGAGRARHTAYKKARGQGFGVIPAVGQAMQETVVNPAVESMRNTFQGVTGAAGDIADYLFKTPSVPAKPAVTTPAVTTPAVTTPTKPVAAPAPSNTFWENQGIPGGAEQFLAERAAPQPVVAQPAVTLASPDYSDVIAQLSAQAMTQGDSGSFDSMLAAKQKREAAQSVLREVGGMRGQDINAAAAQARLDAEAQQGALNREAELQRALLGAGGGPSELETARFALDMAKAQDEQAYRAAQMESENAAKVRAAQEETAARAAAQTAFLAQSGGQLDKSGNVRTPTWFGFSSEVDPELTALHRYLGATNPPAPTYFLPKKER